MDQPNQDQRRATDLQPQRSQLHYDNYLAIRSASETEARMGDHGAEGRGGAGEDGGEGAYLQELMRRQQQNGAYDPPSDQQGAASSYLSLADAGAANGADAKVKGKGKGKAKATEAPAAAGTGERKKRSRLACYSCKSTKQKCDGPVRIPCRRCELYNLECVFPPGPAGSTAAKQQTSTARPPPPPPLALDPSLSRLVLPSLAVPSPSSISTPSFHSSAGSLLQPISPSSLTLPPLNRPLRQQSAQLPPFGIPLGLPAAEPSVGPSIALLAQQLNTITARLGSIEAMLASAPRVSPVGAGSGGRRPPLSGVRPNKKRRQPHQRGRSDASTGSKADGADSMDEEDDDEEDDFETESETGTGTTKDGKRKRRKSANGTHRRPEGVYPEDEDDDDVDGDEEDATKTNPLLEINLSLEDGAARTLAEISGGTPIQGLGGNIESRVRGLGEWEIERSRGKETEMEIDDGRIGTSPATVGSAAREEYQRTDDVITNATLTEGECQALFDFFFSSIQPWVTMFTISTDRSCMHARSRSPLLFHTILLLSTSYSTPFPSTLHSTLLHHVHSLLAPQILSPQPHELTTDFLRALDLLNIYKPTQWAARRAEGKDEKEAMRASKVNGLASWMLQGILSRTAERLDLRSVVERFGKIVLPLGSRTSPEKIGEELVRDLRLYYWLLCNDVQGNIQSGRRSNMDGLHALQSTRIFASLDLQPYDTRLAASVEMFEVARPILRSASYERTRRIPRAELEKFNHGMLAWERHWFPILLAKIPQDPLAMSIICPFSSFISLTYNAAAYSSWKRSARGIGSDSGSETSAVLTNRTEGASGTRGLTDWEYEGLQQGVAAAEQLIFSLSIESCSAGSWKKVQWEEAERADGYRKLVLDETVVEFSKFGLDAVTCVMYIFPLVFMGKLVNEGLLTADLIVNHQATVQPPWLSLQKLPRLLELGASFLDAIAPDNPHHPAKAQALVLRTLLETGLRGRTHVAKGTTSATYRHVGVPTELPPPPRASTHLGSLLGKPASPHSLAPVGSSYSPGLPINSTLAMHQQPWEVPLVSPRLNSNPSSPFGFGVSPTAEGMDKALTAVLEGFDPLFGESSAFWEWGGSDVDWAKIQESMGQ